MSYRVEYQANNRQIETLLFGNEEAANRYAATKKLATVSLDGDDAPDVAVKNLAPRGKARPTSKRRDKKPHAPRPTVESAPRPTPPGTALGDFLRERLAKKEEKAA